jgi:hypothetical protein
MMQGKSGKWLGGVGAVVLAGALALASLGGGVPSAQAHDRNHEHKNPLKQILTKLDEILAKLNGGPAPTSGGGTGTQPLPRFTVLADFNNAAVRDNSTGLVWEQSPTAPTSDWTSARFSCINKTVGGMRGWRLPSVAELTSLIDPSLLPPYVPASTFTGVQLSTYWTATGNENNTSTLKWNVNFADGLAGTGIKGNSSLAWCVRGVMQDSVY